MSSMTRSIIETLTYPRIMMMAQMDPDSCPMRLYFSPAEQKCRHCEVATECHWLNDNDEFSLLAEQPLEQLLEALDFCIDYVSASVSKDCHSWRRCVCESCVWIRDARALGRRIQFSIGES